MVTSCKKVKILSISVLLADAIRRIHQKESLNDLFDLASSSRALTPPEPKRSSAPSDSSELE